ncbi:MAG: hypothetical protein CMJ84_04245 [Planctomycetes bacterium]|jgi:hypothetical protein|nr:hypothetical protein [Planctomycetota bacterium]MDP6408468.1 DUF5916 domain-containing protein [Planctomycetota bacterium]
MFLTPLALSLLCSNPPTCAIEAPDHHILQRPAGTPAPVIDGLLDDALWQSCEPLTGLRQVEPVAGGDPSETTDVRIACDSRALYLAIRCNDRDPAGIRATQRMRDARLNPDDRIELLFDTFLDRRNAFWFQVGAGGSIGDALITKNGSDFNKEWDAIWSARVRRDESGWTAEVEIPAASINFDPAASVWGFNFQREIRRRSESVRWATPDPRFRFFSVAHAGRLTGIGGLEQGLGLDLKPFVTGTATDDRMTGEEHASGDAGGDLFYRISPSTKLSVSINTDFAETEVDARQVNLTRFPLFFPEKRDFFLEDSGIFFFGPSVGFHRRPDVVPFFSRRVGIDEDGGEVPLVASVKVTAQTDSFSLGLLDVQTGSSEGLEERNLFVGRFSKNILDQSDVGLIWTHGHPTAGVESDTVGVDFNYRTDRFAGDRNLQVSTYAMKSATQGDGGDDLAYHVSLRYPNDEIHARLSFTTLEEDFAPALGFVRRNGVRAYEGGLSYRPRMHTGVRRLRFGLAPSWITDMDGNTESAELSVTPFGVEWESGDELDLTVSRETENLVEDFEIHEGVVIGGGDYDFTRAGIELESSDKRELSAEIGVSAGGFFSGERTEYSLEFDWRPNAAALFGFEYELNDVELDEGDFSVHLGRLKADFLFSPRVSWSSFAQWDDVSDEVSLNSRLWWIFSPGREAFVVLNRGWNLEDGGLQPTHLDTTVKIGYTLRF